MLYPFDSKHIQRANAKIWTVVLGSLILLGVLLGVLMIDPKASSNGSDQAETLVMYCAAGIRKPVEAIAKQYEEKYGVKVELQYGGSNTLLNQLEVSKAGDIYLAGDSSYTDLAYDKGLVKERLPLAKIRPVIIVKKGNPKQIKSLNDLLRDDVKVVLGNPDQAAIGKKTRKLVKKAGIWNELNKAVTDRGTFMPTVNEVATAVLAGNQLDAGVVWDATAAQMDKLEAIRIPELDLGEAEITVAAISESKASTEALRFMRYLSSSDQGMPIFKKYGFDVIEGDTWAEKPELTVFSGSVNRPAVDQAINAFEKRHGVVVNRIYNGCGILVSQMHGIENNEKHGLFPDAYLSCDISYHEKIQDRFLAEEEVTQMRMVILTQKGNPYGITSLNDLTQSGIKVGVSNPKESALGGLTERLLKSAQVYEGVEKNVQVKTATGDLLVAQMKAKGLDAAIVYYANCMHVKDSLEIIQLNDPMAVALQTYAVSKSSKQAQLTRMLFEALWAEEQRDSFQAAGFEWVQSEKVGSN